MRFLCFVCVCMCIVNISYAQTTVAVADPNDSTTEADTGPTPSNIQGESTTRGPIPALEVTEDKRYWIELGKSGIENAINLQKNNGIAKNVILFVGDGMGIATVTASRIYKGQLDKKPGEEGYLAFEKFQNVGLLKTYTVDRQVPDSAGTASALFSGVKARSKTVGFDATVKPATCQPDVQEKARVSTVIEWGIDAKKSTGLITTTRITHATPSAAYAHSTHRDWECDKGIPLSERPFGCKDIARQLVEEEPGRSINVILGGGRQQFQSQVNTSTSCWRTDGKDLVWDWMRYQKAQNRTIAFVDTREGLENVNEATDRVFGLFAPDHIPYDKDRNTKPEGQPSLEDMTKKALKILQRNKNGFVLLVEGGRIDHAHHDNLAKVALEEAVALEKAIITAYNMTDPSDTLIIVTADHSHSFTINGYPKRGNPIGGLSDVTTEGFPYQTLSYMNGPGYIYHRMNDTDPKNNVSAPYGSTLNTWRNLNETKEANADRKTRHFAAYWAKDETHGGEDVPVYASGGPMGHLFHGVHEQTHVAFAMAYSACIGPYATICRPKSPPDAKKPNSKKTSSSSRETISFNMLVLAISYQIVYLLFH